MEVQILFFPLDCSLSTHLLLTVFFRALYRLTCTTEFFFLGVPFLETVPSPHRGATPLFSQQRIPLRIVKLLPHFHLPHGTVFIYLFPIRRSQDLTSSPPPPGCSPPCLDPLCRRFFFFPQSCDRHSLFFSRVWRDFFPPPERFEQSPPGHLFGRLAG